MLTVYNCIVSEHDIRLVALAVLICALASFTAISLLHHMRRSTGYVRLAWLVVSAASTGFGIWATHFIAMLAFSPGIPSAYNVALTILSLVAAIILTGTGLAVAVTAEWTAAAWIGGAMVGGGIAAMHYTGMAAFEIQGRIIWDPVLVTASIALGGLIGAIALAVGLHVDRLKCKLIGAMLLTVAICSHHFTAMGAASIVPDPRVEFSPSAIPVGLMAIAVAIASFAIILLTLAGVAIEMRDRRRGDLARARLLDAFNILPEGLALLDNEDRFVLWNKRYVELYPEIAEFIEVGRRFEDVIRLALANGQFPKAQGREEEWLARRMRSRSCHETQLKGDRWVRVEERRTADGGSIGVRIDITELKQREASFRLLFESNPLPMYVFDLESLRIVAANDVALDHYGYGRQQFLDLTVLDIQAAEDHGKFLAALKAMDGYQIAKNWRNVKSDGTEFVAEVYSRQMNYQGRPARFSVIIDVTESTKAREALLESEQMARGIIGTALDAFVQMDEAGQIVEWNPQSENLFGWSRDEAIGCSLADLIVPENYRAAHREGLARFLQSGAGKISGKRREIEALRKDGTRMQVEIAVTSLQRQGGCLFNGFIRDLTEKFAAEAQLRQAHKMEAIGKLTGGVAHDFNNLLTTIIGNLDLLADDIAGNSAARQRLETILHASERGAELTRQMLAFSRRQPLQPKRVDVNRLLDSTTRLLSRTLGENVTVKLLMSSDLWAALVDESQLQTAVMNIAINARDAMPEGGTLCVGTYNAEIEGDFCDSNIAIPPGSYVVIELMDTGYGMRPETLARIFEPFFTTKGPGAGTGLGLSMVYGFVRQSGGYITAYSEAGVGTTFRIYLPFAVASQLEPEAPPRDRAPARAGRGKVILAVDDNSLVRATIVNQLSNLGYKVLEATDAADALKLLDGEEKIDLLFTDIIMPGGLNGKELAIKAKAMRSNLKVLFTSGFPGTSLSNGPMLDDGDVLLSKPYRRHDLGNAIHQMLAS